MKKRAAPIENAARVYGFSKLFVFGNLADFIEQAFHSQIELFVG
ncbi:hypothetical protein HOV93_40480 [Planctomycetes bacterium FF15]|uniref:Uncharacterized protein n=1 Tax=Bremerella alba TaxID=980252 RepID=A0A7V9A8U7_9BACT|nr:hypothetical protein [Bremerella alba]